VITAETQLEGAQSQRSAWASCADSWSTRSRCSLASRRPDFAIAVAPFGNDGPGRAHRGPIDSARAAAGCRRGRAHHGLANAQIGVAIAAYFPDLTLMGTYGFSSSVINGLIKTPEQLSGRSADAERTRCSISAHAPRQFARRAPPMMSPSPTTARRCSPPSSRSKDELIALRILEQQYAVQDRTVKSANEAVRLTINEYKAGIVAYTSVVDGAGDRIGRRPDAAHHSPEPSHRKRRAHSSPRRRLGRGVAENAGATAQHVTGAGTL